VLPTRGSRPLDRPLRGPPTPVARHLASEDAQDRSPSDSRTAEAGCRSCCSSSSNLALALKRAFDQITAAPKAPGDEGTGQPGTDSAESALPKRETLFTQVQVSNPADGFRATG
jgi:hypothetical protein